jgi:alpha-ketoglutarate-dependent 2,4-dichlorophenoxyacetate dioxygenase
MPLSVRVLAKGFAAEIRGVDLRKAPPPAVLDEIYDAFLEYGVLVIPGQDLDKDQHIRFARHFGPLWEVPAWNEANARIGVAALNDISNIGANGERLGADSFKVRFQAGNRIWHSDLSPNAIAGQASMLLAMEIAFEDGETEFADGRAAYEALPQSRRDALDGLIAEHSLANLVGGYEGLETDLLRDRVPPSRHPVVRIHPETGRPNLFVGGYVTHIVGLAKAESDRVIAEVIEASTRPEFVYRHRWAVNDLVIWDNRRMLHRARPYDADRFRRTMHRATVRDRAPTVDGDTILRPIVSRIGPIHAV